MGPIESAVLIALTAVSLTVLLWRPSLLDLLIEAIRNFRGGGPPPMHPSPADDRVLLLRRRRAHRGSDR